MNDNNQNIVESTNNNKLDKKYGVKYAIISIICIIIAIFARFSNLGWFMFFIMLIGPIHALFFLIANCRISKYRAEFPKVKKMFLISCITFVLPYILHYDFGDAGDAHAVFGLIITGDNRILNLLSYTSIIIFIINLVYIVKCLDFNHANQRLQDKMNDSNQNIDVNKDNNKFYKKLETLKKLLTFQKIIYILLLAIVFYMAITNTYDLIQVEDPDYVKPSILFILITVIMGANIILFKKKFKMYLCLSSVLSIFSLIACYLLKISIELPFVSLSFILFIMLLVISIMTSLFSIIFDIDKIDYKKPVNKEYKYLMAIEQIKKQTKANIIMSITLVFLTLLSYFIIATSHGSGGGVFMLLLLAVLVADVLMIINFGVSKDDFKGGAILSIIISIITVLFTLLVPFLLIVNAYLFITSIKTYNMVKDENEDIKKLIEKYDKSVKKV